MGNNSMFLKPKTQRKYCSVCIGTICVLYHKTHKIQQFIILFSNSQNFGLITIEWIYYSLKSCTNICAWNFGLVISRKV